MIVVRVARVVGILNGLFAFANFWMFATTGHWFSMAIGVVCSIIAMILIIMVTDS